jgi:hypothetical protein
MLEEVSSPPPPLLDANKHSCQRDFVSWWTTSISSDAHIAVARRPGDVPVLSWTKIHRIPSTESRNNDRSTIFGSTSSLPTLHQPQCHHGKQRTPVIHRETDLVGFKELARTPSCWSERSTNTHCYQLRDASVKITADVGVELKKIYLSRCRYHYPNDAPQQASANPNYNIEERGPPSSYPRSSKQREKGPRAWPVVWYGGREVVATSLLPQSFSLDSKFSISKYFTNKVLCEQLNKLYINLSIIITLCYYLFNNIPFI